MTDKLTWSSTRREKAPDAPDNGTNLLKYKYLRSFQVGLKDWHYTNNWKWERARKKDDKKTE